MIAEELSTTQQQEEPLYFRAGGEDLFGVLTHPTGTSTSTGVALLSGAHFPSTNRNRLSVRLARKLAVRGNHVLRFDYHGVGESTGVVHQYRLDRPFVTDLAGAARVLEGRGARELIFIGSCLGARTALSFAPRCERLAALVLISPPVRDFVKGDRSATKLALEWSASDYLKRALRLTTLRRLMDKERRRKYVRLLRAKLRRYSPIRRTQATTGWASAGFIEPLEQVVERVPTLVIYGEEDENYDDFRNALQGPLGRIVDNASPTLTIRTFDGELAGFSRMSVQETVTDLILEWLDARREEGGSS